MPRQAKQCYVDDVLGGILKHTSIGDLLEALAYHLTDKLEEIEDHNKKEYKDKPAPVFMTDMVATMKKDIAVVSGAVAGVRKHDYSK